jgi:hypothetical protein
MQTFALCNAHVCDHIMIWQSEKFIWLEDVSHNLVANCTALESCAFDVDCGSSDSRTRVAPRLKIPGPFCTRRGEGAPSMPGTVSSGIRRKTTLNIAQLQNAKSNLAALVWHQILTSKIGHGRNLCGHVVPTAEQCAGIRRRDTCE